MTAVEWLVNEIGHGGLISKKQFAGIIDQAKEMEKQQIIDAWCNALDIKSSKYAEQYYNETFKSE